MYIRFAEADRRVEQAMPEAEDHANKSGHHHLNPRLAARTDSIFTLQHPDSGPAGMKDLQPVWIFEKSKYFLNCKRCAMFKVEAHNRVAFEQFFCELRILAETSMEKVAARDAGTPNGLR